MVMRRPLLLLGGVTLLPLGAMVIQEVVAAGIQVAVEVIQVEV
jgi:hypothetical protein